MGPVPNWNRNMAAISDATCLSTCVGHKRLKPALMAVRTGRGADDDLLEVGNARAEVARSHRQRQIVRALGREPAADPPLVGDAPFELWRRHHLVIDEDGQIAAEVLARQLPELRCAGRLQLE